MTNYRTIKLKGTTFRRLQHQAEDLECDVETLVELLSWYHQHGLAGEYCMVCKRRVDQTSPTSQV